MRKHIDDHQKRQVILEQTKHDMPFTRKEWRSMIEYNESVEHFTDVILQRMIQTK